MNKKQRKLIIISGPSGAGKNETIKQLLKRDKHLQTVVTCTSRARRPFEQDGKDYYFLSQNQFEHKIKTGELLEYQKNHGFYYGTPKFAIEHIWEKNKIPIMQIDVRGGLNIKKIFKKDDVLLIFLTPGSVNNLKTMIYQRKHSMPEAEFKTRMKTAQREFKQANEYDFQIKNKYGQLDNTILKIKQVIDNFLKK